LLLVLKHLLRINPERLGVGRSHGHNIRFTYGLRLHCAAPDGGITNWQRSCSCRPPALGPASPRTPDPPQPAAGLAASPSDRRTLLCLPTPHRRRGQSSSRTGLEQAPSEPTPATGCSMLPAAAGEPEVLQHGGEHAPFLRAAGWICILQEQAVTMERGDGGPAPPCFSPRRAGSRGDHQNQSL